MPDLPINYGLRDILTPLAHKVLLEAGSSAYKRLVVSGATSDAAAGLLRGAMAEQLFAGSIRHPDDAQAALSGLWLWVDELDACHRIAQELASPTGNFWHAIMHRREGDFSNAKYWYHRCPNHHVMKLMGAVADSVASEHRRDPLVSSALSGGWNPDGFVDLVAKIYRDASDPRHALAVRLQGIEWEGLFQYCVREAIESDHIDLNQWNQRIAKSARS